MADLGLQVRQAHTISNAAVGALVQAGDLSLVPCDTRDWGTDGEEVEMPRLSQLLAVTFRKAPVREKRGEREIGGRMPVVRFPRWMYCRKCRRMYYHAPEQDGGADAVLLCPEPTCEKKARLAPMPWVAICANGHMDEVPWQTLAHRGTTNQRQLTCRAYDRLYFTSGKEGQQVRCRACGAKFLLSGLRAPNLLQNDRCEGKQPWLRVSEPCDKELQVAGLGDHFAHYPVQVSALDIPPDSRRDPRDDTSKRIREHREWRTLLDLFERHGKDNHVVRQKVSTIATQTGCQTEQVWALLAPPTQEPQAAADAPAPCPETQVLRREEYKALLARITDYREYERFITVSRTDLWHEWLRDAKTPPDLKVLGRHIIELVGVTRLREVRALKGFTRVNPPDNPDVRLVPADMEGRSTWLPVAEFYGEGVFLAMEHQNLLKWASLPAVQLRNRLAQHGFEASPWPRRLGIEPDALPAFVALHTFSHLLIREMAFECGYPAASLRERLYFGGDGTQMAGVLIYLAAGEPGGSLGGIANLSEPQRFAALLARCAETAAWCALDPVCAENEGRGEQSYLNRAACHACCLLPETSCEVGNLMLDRRLVVSLPAEEKTGLFDLPEK